ncbi:type II toxin-antitoxin system RelE/ParE family toxin [candidate division KSB1 bacterium]|nr:type II toxin-antitoxin system RelE/ParE family toxin [candidate division KSB1 bacterium]
MKVVWTKEALEQLVEIEAFIARGSSARANEFVERLIKRGQSLARFPYRGRIVPEFSQPEIREIFEKSYRIVYRIHKARVEILTVFEGHRLLRKDEISPTQ